MRQILFALAVLLLSLGAARAAGETYQVVGVEAHDVLNMRAGPGAQYRTIGRMPPTARGVAVLSAPVAVGRGFWVQVSYQGLSGWVNQRYLAQETRPPVKVIRKRGGPFALPKEAAGDVEAGVRVALVVGNGAYRRGSSIPPLHNAANDGRDIAAALRKLGFEVIEAIDADLDGMRNSLDAFRKRAEGARIALFFFAGHGLQVSGENYLLPVSADVGRHEDVLRQSVSLSEVMGALIRAAPDLSLVILDACRNNPVTTALSESALSRGLERIDIRPGLARRKGAPGMLIAYSTDPDNVASDGSGRNSPFTRALLRNIGLPELDVRLMFGEVRTEVVKQTSGKQTPWVEEAVIGRFYFRPPPKIRKDRFHGVWDHEHYTLKIDADTVRLLRPPYVGDPPRVLAANSKECTDLFEQEFSIVPVEAIPATFTDPQIESWARASSRGKSLLVMSMTCGYGAHRFYLLLTEYQKLLLVEFSEQDFLMREEFYRSPQ